MLSINQVMKHSPETISPKDTIKDISKILADREFHALPVVDHEKVVGIIITTYIINYFLQQV
ncbi:MAG: CBS domain-containing protein [Bacteroidota bacterium]